MFERQQLQNHSAHTIGKVVSVSDSGITVRIKGSSKTMTIPNASQFTLQAGDDVLLSRVNGNSQTLEVSNYAGYSGSGAAT